LPKIFRTTLSLFAGAAEEEDDEDDEDEQAAAAETGRMTSTSLSPRSENSEPTNCISVRSVPSLDRKNANRHENGNRMAVC
jgi:hypothetical protein